MRPVPWRSASTTTPTGMEWEDARRGGAPAASSRQPTSVDPPPISKASARRGRVHQQRRAAGEGERRLLVIADDLDLDPGLAPDPADELGAIVGAPAGLGRDAAGMGHALAAHLAGADLEGLDGAVHGGAGERAARTQPLAQADDSRERVDDAEPLASRPRHQQPAVVGAEVERGQHSPVAVDRTPPVQAGRLQADIAVQVPAPRMPATAPAGAPAPIFGIDPNRLSPAVQESAKDQWGEGPSGRGAAFRQAPASRSPGASAPAIGA